MWKKYALLPTLAECPFPLVGRICNSSKVVWDTDAWAGILPCHIPLLKHWQNLLVPLCLVSQIYVMGNKIVPNRML